LNSINATIQLDAMLLGRSGRSQTYRLSARASEQRTREALDRVIKKNWQEIAIKRDVGQSAADA
jgi:hypothetical protein